MLCKLRLESEGDILLPFNYNHIIQGFLYRFINEESFAAFLHDTGYEYNSRVFKLFSFSNIMSKPLRVDRQNKFFTFPKEILLYVSSVDNDFFRYIFSGIVREEGLMLGRNLIRVPEMSLIEQKVKDKIQVEALSPVTAYNTLLDAEGRKKTYYLHPREKDFSEYIRGNLLKKYLSYYGEEPKDQKFEIRPVGYMREKAVTYKKFIIKGSMGNFELEGSRELLEMALCAGIGGKNSMGFGLIKMIR